LKQAFPGLSGEALKLALYHTAEDLGPVGEDNTYGMGLIDTYAAYECLEVSGGTSNNITVSNRTLSANATYKAGSTLSASNVTVNSGATVNFKAGNNVKFKTGFRARKGSKIYARSYCGSATFPNQMFNSLRETELTDLIVADAVDNSIASSITIYPNPTTDKLMIRHNEHFIGINYSVMIIDSQGKEMFYKEAVDKNSFEINSENWKSGIYYGRIYQDDKNYSFKIVKE